MTARRRFALVFALVFAVAAGGLTIDATKASAATSARAGSPSVVDDPGGTTYPLCNAGTYRYQYAPTYGTRWYYCGSVTAYQYAWDGQWWVAPGYGLYLYLQGTWIPA